MKLSKDFELLEKSLAFAWNEKLTVVFKNKTLLKKILILAFDKHGIYVLTKIPLASLKNPKKISRGYLLYKLNHNIPLESEDFSGWWNGIKKKEFLSYFPNYFTNQSQLLWPRISGSLPSLFLAYHKTLKKKIRPWDPYYTQESYMATIIHEFAHAYFDATYLPWHGSKEQNLELLNNAYELFLGKKITLKNLVVNPPLSPITSETFAFCTEYFASTMFWPNHKKAVDKELSMILPLSIRKEKIKNLNFESSILDNEPHLAAAIFGKIIIAKLGSAWPTFFDKNLL